MERRHNRALHMRPASKKFHADSWSLRLRIIINVNVLDKQGIKNDPFDRQSAQFSKIYFKSQFAV